MLFLNILKTRLHCISAEFFVCHTLTCIVTHLKSLQLNMVLEGSFKGQLVLTIKNGFKGGVTPSQKSSESGLCDMKANFMFRPHDLHLKLSRDMKDWDYVKIKFRFKPVKLLESDWLKSKNYLQC